MGYYLCTSVAIYRMEFGAGVIPEKVNSIWDLPTPYTDETCALSDLMAFRKTIFDSSDDVIRVYGPLILKLKVCSEDNWNIKRIISELPEEPF